MLMLLPLAWNAAPSLKRRGSGGAAVTKLSAARPSRLPRKGGPPGSRGTHYRDPGLLIEKVTQNERANEALEPLVTPMSCDRLDSEC